MAGKKEKQAFGQMAIVGVLVVVVIGAAFWVGKLTTELKLLKSEKVEGGAQQPEITEAAELTSDQWQKLLVNPAATQGEEGARVTMVEFTDYQCPFCKRAFEQTYPELVKKYIDAGKMRYVVRDLPLSFHQNAKPAALAARCAGEQGKYWQMHDQLFKNQDQWVNLSQLGETFKSYARQLGLNQNQFGSCFDEEKYNGVIEADLALANQLGATGTPTFFINGRSLVGAQPLAAFESVIEEELKK
ncbi:MAG: DsbA family protein [Candidatus Chisholmbacteria bacterium]|nr:DsbA family protein [Candidatus Chisholmbacteria bacterium]